MYESFGVSDHGCVRRNNEDYYVLAPEMGLYVVADGMGGAQAGEHASKLAADTVADHIRKVDSPSTEALIEAVEEANRSVLQAASGDAALEGMGTTLVAALEIGAELLIVSVGDSRAYKFEDGKLEVVTEDQSWVYEVGRRLGLDETSLKNHPMRHVLTMAIGVGPQIRINRYKLRPGRGAQILVCSDGLHGVVPDAAIIETLASRRSIQEKCNELVEAARNAGGPDNITAVILRAL